MGMALVLFPEMMNLLLILLALLLENIVVKTIVPQPNLYLFFENIRKILCRSEKIVHKVIKAIPVIIIQKIAYI
jgi:hypothetical protein